MPMMPAAVVEGSGSFTDPGPPPVAGYTAWYDPSDVNTWTRVGQSVTALADKSGNGLTLTVGSSVGEPFMSPMGFPGRFAIPFRAASVWSSNQTMSDISSSVFVVACHTYIGGAGRILTGPNNTGGYSFYVGASLNLTTDSAAVANMATTAGTVPLGTPFVGGSIAQANSCRQYINLTGETDANAVASLTGSRTLQLGAQSGTGSFVGWIGEAVFYDTTLSNGDAESVIAHLMTKWDI